MFQKKIDTQTAIHPLLATRWSGRAYDPTRPLARDQLISLIEAARWAPSCYGDEPWRFIVFDQSTNEAAWQKAIDCLLGGNRVWAVNAPLLFLANANAVSSKNGEPNRWGQYDTGAAAENLCLQASSLGLMCHQMGGFDATKAKADFNIPEHYTPMAMIAVGYQLAEADIPLELKEREYNPRTRAPIATHFFDGAWDEPIETTSV